MIYSAQNKTVNFNQLSIEVADGGRRTLVVQAYYQNAAGLTDGQVLQLGLDGDTDVSLVPNGTQMSGGNTVVNNGAGTRVAVAATALGLATPPADSRVIDANDEVVSGLEFEVQPLIQARDAAGNTDVDFNGSVSLVLGAVGAGQLSGTKTVGLTDGQAQFTDLAYAAQTDGEAFTLVFSMAGDQARAQLRAPATELADVSVALSADAVATKLIFSTAPAGALSGQPLVVQPVVEAQDARGLTDGEFAGTVELTTAAAGNLVNSVQQAVEGVAAFVDLTYEATADHQAFSLEATAQGDDADLTRALADALDADVLATRLAFTTQPSNGVNRQPLAVTPVVAALDGAGLRDADFTGEVRLGLAEPGGGGEFDPIEGSEGLANPVSTAVAGVAQFPDLRVLRGAPLPWPPR